MTLRLLALPSTSRAITVAVILTLRALASSLRCFFVSLKATLTFLPAAAVNALAASLILVFLPPERIALLTSATVPVTVSMNGPTENAKATVASGLAAGADRRAGDHRAGRVGRRRPYPRRPRHRHRRPPRRRLRHRGHRRRRFRGRGLAAQRRGIAGIDVGDVGGTGVIGAGAVAIDHRLHVAVVGVDRVVARIAVDVQQAGRARLDSQRVVAA